MARYVIDPPTLVHLVGGGLTVDPQHQLVAPNSIRFEVLELLWDDVRRGVRTDREALAVHERVTELKMRLLGDGRSRATAWRIAREHGLGSLAAAQYLALTRLQADALVTVDRDLAASAEGVVPTAPVEVLLATG
jgi:predicted nucleic acid-binding protein